MGIDTGGMSRRRLTSIGSTVVAVITALAVWWLSDGPGADEPPPAPATSAAASESASPSSSTTPSPPSSTPSESPTPTEGGDPSYSATTPSEEPGDMPATDPASGLPYVALADLPPEAASTVGLIDAGGPFPYDEDGSRFGNYEGILPDEDDGYYEEYTVETPGLSHRGARRVVRGAEGELYWTEDHYESFERIWR